MGIGLALPGIRRNKRECSAGRKLYCPFIRTSLRFWGLMWRSRPSQLSRRLQVSICLPVLGGEDKMRRLQGKV